MARKKKQQENGSKYYELDNILSKNADYNLIFGERSNGKTYAALKHILTEYINKGVQGAYIRRWREDINGKRMQVLFQALVNNGEITTLTDGKFTGVFYISGKFFLSRINEENGKIITDKEPFCFSFCLSEQEHDKSTSFPNVCNIVFDEFLTRRYYLPNEFMLFMNVISTIVRNRDNVKIFMLGNTVNRFCPYFEEMGLTNVQQQEQGTIDIYQCGDNGLLIAVEYCGNIDTQKPSNKYFSFDNKALKMITGGKWELAAYPHLPRKYDQADVIFKYYIVFNGAILQANIIQVDNDNFTFIHAKTTPIKETPETVIYSLDMDGKPNHKRKLLSNSTRLETMISSYFVRDKVFYQSNEIGEVVRNYILTSTKSNILSNY